MCVEGLIYTRNWKLRILAEKGGERKSLKTKHEENNCAVESIIMLSVFLKDGEVGGRI